MTSPNSHLEIKEKMINPYSGFMLISVIHDSHSSQKISTGLHFLKNSRQLMPLARWVTNSAIGILHGLSCSDRNLPSSIGQDFKKKKVSYRLSSSSSICCIKHRNVHFENSPNNTAIPRSCWKAAFLLQWNVHLDIIV